MNNNNKEEEHIMNDINIFDAIRNNNIKEVREYFIANGDINSQNEYGNCPLHWATTCGHEAIVQYLIANDADVNILNRQLETALHHAAMNGRDTIVQCLIAHGADVNIQNTDKRTPLHYAAYNGHDSIVQYLIANGADLNTKNDEGNTPAHYAAGRGHKITLQCLITNGANLNIQNNNGQTPLHLTTNFCNFWSSSTEVIIKLLLPLTNLTNIEDSYKLYKSKFNTEVEGKEGEINELIMEREYERFFTFCELFSIGTNPVEEDDNKKQEKNSLMIGYDAPLDVNEEEEARPFPPMFDSNLDASLFDATLVGEIWDYARDFLRVDAINNYEE